MTNVRRVISGTSEDGSSEIWRDTIVESRSDTRATSVIDIWRPDSVPLDPTADDSPVGVPELSPPSRGAVVRIAIFPPDIETGRNEMTDEDMRAHLETIGGADSFRPPKVTPYGKVVMHQTPSVDVAYVAEGEIVAVLDSEETLLRTGDVFVQRGTNHAWSNRSDRPATVLFILFGAIQ